MSKMVEIDHINTTGNTGTIHTSRGTAQIPSESEASEIKSLLNRGKTVYAELVEEGDVLIYLRYEVK